MPSHPGSLRDLAWLWAGTVALCGCLLLALQVTPVRQWVEGQTGEQGTLSQIKAMTDLARQVTRPRVRTADSHRMQSTVVSPYGVNSFLHHEVGEARRGQVMALARQAGFVYLRQPMPWQDVEIHGRGDYEDRRNDPARSAWFKYDTIVRQAQAQGMEIVLRLDNPPTWSRTDGDALGSQAPPSEFEDFAAFAEQVARRYRGRIRHYQIWNEPNIYPEWGMQPVSPEDYTELLRLASEAIRGVDPDAVIVAAALAATTTFDGDRVPGGNLSDLVYLQRMYDAGAAPYFDVLAVQGYGLWSGPTDRRMHPLVLNFSRARFVRDLMVQRGDAAKPMWISEMNWNAVPAGQSAPFGRVSLATQARYLPLAYERIREWPWVEMANVWYLKRAQPDWENRNDPQAYFRLMTYDGELMPVYRAIQAYLAAERDETGDP